MHSDDCRSKHSHRRQLLVTNYYFVSSPLHFFIACNLARQREAKNKLILISKNRPLTGRLAGATKAVPDLFDEVIDLCSDSSANVKHRLAQIFSITPPLTIFTGNDRRFEFQYAMHIARASNAEVKGVYMDDGAISYIGHKSINNIAHRYIDPFLKKLGKGLWWKNSLTTGASNWISEAYLAFPELAHPLLKKKLNSKSIHQIDSSLFSSEAFTKLATCLIMGSTINLASLKPLKLLISLPHEAAYKEKPEYLRRFFAAATASFGKNEIAIKGHPRSVDDQLLSDLFPETLVIDKHVGFEFLLPLLPEDITIVGDASTTLLSAKWLRPEIATQLLTTDNADEDTLDLFSKLDIHLEQITS